ncbi:MAG: hypothetical protein WCE87_05885 [Candidatus Udaeobacter sp.]
MKPSATMRVARPTDNLTAIAEMYAKGLGFTVLARFENHRGFDGVILVTPNSPTMSSSPRNEDIRSARPRPGIICWSFTFQTSVNGKQAVHR